jgi:4-carboxymuconolactone decarboxylase
MSSGRYNKGIETLGRLVDQNILKETVNKVKKFHPDFEEILVETAFGDIWSRSTLSLQQREIVTITSMLTQGAVDQLPFHINAALNIGLTPAEITEICLHCVPYIGFPRALGALFVVMEVFEERGIEFGEK